MLKAAEGKFPLLWEMLSSREWMCLPAEGSRGQLLVWSGLSPTIHTRGSSPVQGPEINGACSFPCLETAPICKCKTREGGKQIFPQLQIFLQCIRRTTHCRVSYYKDVLLHDHSSKVLILRLPAWGTSRAHSCVFDNSMIWWKPHCMVVSIITGKTTVASKKSWQPYCKYRVLFVLSNGGSNKNQSLLGTLLCIFLDWWKTYSGVSRVSYCWPLAKRGKWSPIAVTLCLTQRQIYWN